MYYLTTGEEYILYPFPLAKAIQVHTTLPLPRVFKESPPGKAENLPTNPQIPLAPTAGKKRVKKLVISERRKNEEEETVSKCASCNPTLLSPNHLI